jgi:hypothetical protein
MTNPRLDQFVQIPVGFSVEAWRQGIAWTEKKCVTGVLESAPE